MRGGCSSTYTSEKCVKQWSVPSLVPQGIGPLLGRILQGSSTAYLKHTGRFFGDEFSTFAHAMCVVMCIVYTGTRP